MQLGWWKQPKKVTGLSFQVTRIGLVNAKILPDLLGYVEARSSEDFDADCWSPHSSKGLLGGALTLACSGHRAKKRNWLGIVARRLSENWSWQTVAFQSNLL